MKYKIPREEKGQYKFHAMFYYSVHYTVPVSYVGICDHETGCKIASLNTNKENTRQQF